jgi:hypothetical protein
MQTFEKILQLIDQSTTDFQGSIPDMQKKIYGDLQEYIKKLDLRDGRIMNNLQNLQLIGQIKNRLRKILSGKDYNKLVSDFTEAFDEVANLNQQYFADFNFKFKPKKTLPVIKQLAIDQTIEDLIGQGMAESIIKPITEILKSNITTGGSYAKFQEQLRTHIVNDENGAGSLQRYTKQITTDAINQFNAQYHDTIAQDLQFNWGQYVGSNLTTTREFCERLTAKEWVHRTELPSIIKGKIDGVDIKLSKTTGLPVGMIPGTNVDNFKVNRGGYQCGHQFFWVPDNAVPDAIKKKFENKGKSIETKTYATASTKVKSIIDNNKEQIEALEDRGVVFYNDIAEHWDDDVTISLSSSESTSYYDPKSKVLLIADTERLKNDFYKQNIMIHEGGHAFHSSEKIITFDGVDKSFEKVFKKAKKVIAGSEREIDDLLRDNYLNESSTQEQKNKITIFSDTLGALTDGIYGSGHSAQYYKTKNLGRMEFFAHAMSLLKLENEYSNLNETTKKLTEIMIAYAKSIL